MINDDPTTWPTDTLKQISFDKEGNFYLSNSPVRAINFDDVKEQSYKKLGFEFEPKSADALIVTNGSFYLIEFKNKVLDNIGLLEILKKMYDSLIVYSRLTKKDIPLFSKKGVYVLVYNPKKINARNISNKNKVGQSANFNRFVNNMHQYAHKPFSLVMNTDEVRKTAKLYFQNFMLLGPEEFDNWVRNLDTQS